MCPEALIRKVFVGLKERYANGPQLVFSRAAFVNFECHVHPTTASDLGAVCRLHEKGRRTTSCDETQWNIDYRVPLWLLITRRSILFPVLGAGLGRGHGVSQRLEYL